MKTPRHAKLSKSSLMYDDWLYIVRFSRGDYCPTVVYKIEAVRIGRLKEIIDDITGHANGST